HDDLRLVGEVAAALSAAVPNGDRRAGGGSAPDRPCDGGHAPGGGRRGGLLEAETPRLVPPGRFCVRSRGSGPGTAEDLAAEPDQRVVPAVDDALLHRDDRVVGDLDVFRADLGAALGDVAVAEALS